MSHTPDKCPFCGGDAVLYGMSHSTLVRCLDCGAEGSPRFFDPEDDDKIAKAEAGAIEAWNQRAS